MISFTEVVAIELSRAHIAPLITFDTAPDSVSGDGRPCRSFHLRFDGKKRRGIQALYTDGTFRSVAYAKRGVMTYEVLEDATFVMIGVYKKRGWVQEELIFTSRDKLDVDKLVTALRGLYDHHRVSHKRLEEVMTRLLELDATLQRLHDQDRFLGSSSGANQLTVPTVPVARQRQPALLNS